MTKPWNLTPGSVVSQVNIYILKLEDEEEEDACAHPQSILIWTTVTARACWLQAG